ncbi:nudix hydrolase 12, mitochondrial-like [Thalictrum thalictroides]|uniref:Nudix hydrolase 12, mitochondrial-like n=1 Tax=Thalictrum thalictroides TaxID=46969 RepID=A0A7J6UYV1_THATH|nr:nudix hydrolase 12, mitochondrial-like [Thalictrum thalictroides]
MSSSLLARQGRHRQRYENEYRLVAGCIPYRFNKDSDDDTDDFELEVLMISSPNRDDLVFPKGGWENDETVYEAARREALEEAGVKGILDENPLGVWIFRSKSSQNSGSLEGSCKGYMYAMEVTEEYGSWAEEDLHRRRWLNVADAYRLCRYEWMQSALEEFVRVMGEAGKCQTTEDLFRPPALPVQDVLVDHQILSPSCLFNNSSTQRIDETYNKCFVLG